MNRRILPRVVVGRITTLNQRPEPVTNEIEEVANILAGLAQMIEGNGDGEGDEEGDGNTCEAYLSDDEASMED